MGTLVNFDKVEFDFEQYLNELKRPINPDEIQSRSGNRLSRKVIKKVVCTHWLRRLCKKGDECEFLHELQRDKVAPCVFFMQGACTKKNCNFRHDIRVNEVQECKYYNGGRCIRGPECRMRHVSRVACPSYMAGFCPLGPLCTQGAHPKYESEADRAKQESQQHSDRHQYGSASYHHSNYAEDVSG